MTTRTARAVDPALLAEVARSLIELGHLHRAAVFTPPRPRGREITDEYDIHTSAGTVSARLTSAEAVLFARLTGARLSRKDPS